MICYPITPRYFKRSLATVLFFALCKIHSLEFLQKMFLFVDVFLLFPTFDPNTDAKASCTLVPGYNE